MNPPMPWSLQRRVMALSLLICTVLAFLAAGATTTAVANRGQLDTLLDSVGPMRAASLDLEEALNAQAAAVTGIVLTGSADERLAYHLKCDEEHRKLVGRIHAVLPGWSIQQAATVPHVNDMPH